MLLNTSSIPALIALFDHNNHLPHFFALSERYYGIQNGIFLDIGANVGTTSIEATEFGNVTKVISFEPSSDTYALLMANIFLNKLENRIAGYRYAVGEKRALNKLMFSPVGSGDNRLRKEEHGADFQQRYNDVGISLSEDVETVAIDELLDEKLSSIKYVWIDVQGYEYFVLKGCEKLLNHNNISVQIEYWPHGLNETNSLDLLNNFLIERFSGYVDMNEYTENGAVVHDIGDIVFLAKSLLDVNSNFHTDLFLLK
jgi:FkbM family methyltransferase